jgi:uncharacterized protein
MPTLHDFLVLAPLAMIAGFAAQRGQICSVLAAKQLVETGRASRLIAFFYAMAWVVVLTFPLSVAFPDSIKLSGSLTPSVTFFIAGMIYGLGAFINGACLFGICSRSVSGSAHYLAALPGLIAGSAFATAYGAPQLLGSPAPSPLYSSSVAFVAMCVAAAIVAVMIVTTMKSIRRAKLSWQAVLTASRWRTSLALAVIACTSGLLFAMGDPAGYPTFFKQIGAVTFGTRTHVDPATAICTIALFAGSTLSRYLGGRNRFVAPTPIACARSFTGGFIMSAAATAIPGGNDIMVLYAIPGLALNSILAYAAMMLTLTSLIYVSSVNERRRSN